MDSTAVSSSQQHSAALFSFVWQILLPAVVAFFVSLGTQGLVERKDRRRQSKIGASIIDTLLEELGTGIGIMATVEAAVNDPLVTDPIPTLTQRLPSECWSGAQTIPDDVLLRIKAAAATMPNHALPVADCRIHCKNYFRHMCTNYNNAANLALGAGDQWKLALLSMLGRPRGTYLHDASFVRDLVQHAKELLEANAKRWFPK